MEPEFISFRSAEFSQILKTNLKDIEHDPEMARKLLIVYDRINCCICCLDSSRLCYCPSVFYDIARNHPYKAEFTIFELIKFIMDNEIEVCLANNAVFMANIYREMKTHEDELIILRLYNNFLAGNNFFLGLNPEFYGVINAIVEKMKHCAMYFQLNHELGTEHFLRNMNKL